jgi:hypothetical protein
MSISAGATAGSRGHRSKRWTISSSGTSASIGSISSPASPATAPRSVYATAVRAAGQTARPPLLAQALVAFEGVGLARFRRLDTLWRTRFNFDYRREWRCVQPGSRPRSSDGRALYRIRSCPSRSHGFLIQRRLRWRHERTVVRDRGRPGAAELSARQSFPAQDLPGGAPLGPDRRPG